MLTKHQSSIADRAWDLCWSSGITNPVTVADLLSTLLMGLAENSAAYLINLKSAIHSKRANEIASGISRIRALHGIEPGSEIEQDNFWEQPHDLGLVLEKLEEIESNGKRQDLIGDLYEHILNKLSTAGKFGQFRTPAVLVNFIVKIIPPRDGDRILDPAAGTGGFLVAASLGARNKSALNFCGIEIDRTISRLATANLHFHSILNSSIILGDGLDLSIGATPSLIYANPPFAGIVNREQTTNTQIESNKTEILFLAAIAERLGQGGRAAVIVPDGVINSNSIGARQIRRFLVQENSLKAVIEFPAGSFKPYTDVKTALLVWEKSKPLGEVFFGKAKILNDGKFASISDQLSPSLSELEDNFLNQKSGLHSKWVPMKLITETKFSLNPGDYIENSMPSIDASGQSASEILNEIIASLTSPNLTLGSPDNGR